MTRKNKLSFVSSINSCALIVLLILDGVTLFACPKETQFIATAINISGNKKTKQQVILNELNFKEGDRVCESQIQEGVENLKNTGLFLDASYKLSSNPKSNTADVNLNVTEKWTTIPILKANSGGGVSQYTIGVYDPNVAGQFLELGGQFESLGNAESGVVWFKNPRLFGKRQGTDLQYWNTKRIRLKYDQGIDDPLIKSGFLMEREKIYADYFKELTKKFTLRISFEYNDDSFSTQELPAEVLEKINSSSPLPPATELVIYKTGLEFGKIFGEPQLLRGQLGGIYISYADALDKNTESFSQQDLTYVLHHPISARLGVAQRALLGATSTNVLQYWFYLGGLDRIRGFADNRLAGRKFALSNTEFRYIVSDKPSAVLQAVGFIDLAMIGEKFSDLDELAAASLGAGMRLILPKYYRFVLRLDYAKPLIKKDSENWSVGVQQFF